MGLAKPDGRHQPHSTHTKPKYCIPRPSAIETDEKMAADLAGLGYHINRSNLLVLESKADMRGQASPDDGDALALTFAQPVALAEVEEEDEEDEFGRSSGYSGSSSGSGWMR